MNIEFARYLREHYGEEIDTDAMLSIKICANRISDLSGIEYFPNLEKLDVHFCELRSIDISSNTVLKKLDCSYNSLASLDVSNNTNLGELNCRRNRLISLDMSKQTSLNGLDCSDNQLAYLDLGENRWLLT